MVLLDQFSDLDFHCFEISVVDQIGLVLRAAKEVAPASSSINGTHNASQQVGILAIVKIDYLTVPGVTS